MANRRDDLLDAAIDVLGVHELTHRAVDATAGLPAGSPSNYFRTRDALLDAVVERFSTRERAIWEGLAAEAYPTTPPALAEVMAMAARVATEITVIGEPCPCGSAHTWIEDVQGRLDDSLTYAGAITVHPILVRSPLGRQRNIAEYQVHQTHRGVTVLVRLVGDVDLEALRREIATALAEVGMVDPEVVLVPVERISRQASGKVQRIVPLDAI